MEEQGAKRRRVEDGVDAVIIVGPSGVGKSTLVDRLVAEHPGCFGYSVSHTTRGPREGEVDGVDYHFTEADKMRLEIEQGSFIEHAEVHGSLYGTSIAAVDKVVDAGQTCLLILDVQGAESVKKHALDARTAYVFISPPNDKELEQRLRSRGTETEEKIQRRLTTAKKEMEYLQRQGFWDRVLVNNDLEETYSAFNEFIEKVCGRKRSVACLASGGPQEDNLKALPAGA